MLVRFQVSANSSQICRQNSKALSAHTIAGKSVEGVLWCPKSNALNARTRGAPGKPDSTDSAQINRKLNDQTNAHCRTCVSRPTPMRKCNRCGKWVHLACHPVGISVTRQQSARGTYMPGLRNVDSQTRTMAIDFNASTIIHMRVQNKYGHKFIWNNILSPCTQVHAGTYHCPECVHDNPACSSAREKVRGVQIRVGS